MAESYLTRRGSSGGGGLGGMNVTIGTSPPSDKVGLFVNSETISTDICYVSPNGIGAGGSWTILSGSTPTNSNYSFPAANGNTVYISSSGTGTIYKYDTISNTFSSWTTISSVGYNGTYSWECCVSDKLYHYSTSSTTNAIYDILACNLSTDIWSNIGSSPSGSAIPFGCAYFSNNIFTACNMWRSGNNDGQLRLFSTNLQSNISTIVANTSVYFNNDLLYKGTVVSDGVSLYAFGGINRYATFGLKWNMQTGDYVIFKGPCLDGGPSDNQYLMTNVTTGYIDGDYLRALSSASLNTTKISLNMTTNQSFIFDDSFELPMSPSNRDHTSQIAKVGTDLYAFNFGSSMQSILKYKSSTGDFENNSIIVECSLNGNECEIVSGEDGNITVSVGKVYYIDDSGNMSEITSQCQVRTTGGNWQQIQ